MSARLRRGLVLLAVVAAHVLVFRFFPHLDVAPRDQAEREDAFTVLVLPGSEMQQPAALRAPARSVARPSTADRSSSRNPQERRPPASPASSAIHPPIDWMKEAELAAAAHLESDAAAVRRAGALSSWKERIIPAPSLPAPSTFRWDHAHTHRVEGLPMGGLVVNLSERCAIALIYLAVIPTCKIGHIDSHGDLFDHMHDPPAPDAWNR